MQKKLTVVFSLDCYIFLDGDQKKISGPQLALVKQMY